MWSTWYLLRLQQFSKTSTLFTLLSINTIHFCFIWSIHKTFVLHYVITRLLKIWLLNINFSWGRSIMEWVRKTRKWRGGIFSRKMRHWRSFALVLFFLQSYPFPLTFEWKRYLETASITCCVGKTPTKCILQTYLLGSSSKY